MNVKRWLFVWGAGFFALHTAAAAVYCVRAGAAGSGDGSDWANAFPALPASLERGSTYYVADGSYGSYTFDDPESGEQVITVKKATAADHGPDAGWQSAYGDGQAVFSDMHFAAGHYIVDGQRRDESNWQDVTSYGFRNTGSIFSSALNPGPACADDLTIRYMDIGGPSVGNTYSASNPSSGIYMGGFGEFCSNWTVSRCHIHNVGIAVQGAGQNGLLIEHTWIGPSWSKEAVRGQIRFSNSIIRHNIMWNSCQMDPLEGSSSGCTAEIAIWGGGAGMFDGNQIYGNVFQKTTNEVNSGGAIVVGGNGVSWVGSPANNTLVYNNTIVGLKGWHADILINGGSGNIVRNNLWADVAGSFTGASAGTASNNAVVDTASFIDYPTNLRLSGPTEAGASLSPPYHTDMGGAVRGADGTWDLGAFEYASTTGGDNVSPASPKGLKVR